jgi:hypothetical protein
MERKGLADVDLDVGEVSGEQRGDGLDRVPELTTFVRPHEGEALHQRVSPVGLDDPDRPSRFANAAQFGESTLLVFEMMEEIATENGLEGAGAKREGEGVRANEASGDTLIPGKDELALEEIGADDESGRGRPASQEVDEVPALTAAQLEDRVAALEGEPLEELALGPRNVRVLRLPEEVCPVRVCEETVLSLEETGPGHAASSRFVHGR